MELQWEKGGQGPPQGSSWACGLGVQPRRGHLSPRGAAQPLPEWVSQVPAMLRPGNLVPAGLRGHRWLQMVSPRRGSCYCLPLGPCRTVGQGHVTPLSIAGGTESEPAEDSRALGPGAKPSPVGCGCPLPGPCLLPGSAPGPETLRCVLTGRWQREEWKVGVPRQGFLSPSQLTALNSIPKYINSTGNRHSGTFQGHNSRNLSPTPHPHCRQT